MSEQTSFYKKLLTLYFKEEWRLHKDLFGGTRFFLFPLVLGVLTAALTFGVNYLDLSALSIGSIIGGIHIIMLLFGFQTGTIVFTNRDQIDNLLSDYAPLIQLAPSSVQPDRSFVMLFILKDIVYYSLLTMLPIAVGFIPFIGVLNGGFLFLSFVFTFSFGVTGMIFGVNILTIGGRIAGAMYGLGLTGILGGFFYWFNVYTPYQLFSSQQPEVLGLFTLLAVTTIGSVRFYARGSLSREETIHKPEITGGTSRETALYQKISADLSRSRGGYGLIAFSVLVTALVAYFLVTILDPISSTLNRGLLFSIVMMMGLSFTVYSELSRNTNYNEFISLGYYIEEVFKAIFNHYFFFAIVPTVVISLLLYPQSILVTAVTASLLGFYYFSVLSLAAGLQPEEALFDVVRFGFITVFLGLGSLPPLIYSIFYDSQLWSAVLTELFGSVPDQTLTVLIGAYVFIILGLSVAFRQVSYTYWDVKSRFA